jgi:hypothetical protein
MNDTFISGIVYRESTPSVCSRWLRGLFHVVITGHSVSRRKIEYTHFTSHLTSENISKSPGGPEFNYSNRASRPIMP